MKNGKKQLRLQDITYYSNNRDHPFSYSRSRSRTPKHKNSTLPQTCVNKGMMRQTILERLRDYKYGNPSKYHKTIDELKYDSLMKEVDEVKQVPQINMTSKKLYTQIKQKRNLSPKVLVRFQQYERTKSIKKMQMKVQTYMNERKKLPKPQDIVKSNKIEQLQIARKVIASITNKEPKKD